MTHKIEVSLRPLSRDPSLFVLYVAGKTVYSGPLATAIDRTTEALVVLKAAGMQPIVTADIFKEVTND